MLTLIKAIIVCQVAAKFCADADGTEDGDFGDNCPLMAAYPQTYDKSVSDNKDEYFEDYPKIRFDSDHGHTLGDYPGQYPEDNQGYAICYP